MPAVAATQAQKAVGQDAALEEGVELVLDELRQVGAGCGLSLLEEGRGVLLHRAIQLGLFGAVALVVDRGAIRHRTARVGRDGGRPGLGAVQAQSIGVNSVNSNGISKFTTARTGVSIPLPTNFGGYHSKLSCWSLR